MHPLKTAAAALLLLLGATGCPNPGGGGADGGTKGDGGVKQNGAFTYATLEPTEAMDPKYLSMAVGPQDRVGMAYFVQVAGGRPASFDGGGTELAPNFELRYAEWNAGTVSAPQKVATVQRVYGTSLAFHPQTGEPSVAYLGGAEDGSLYWFQSDVAVSTRSGGVWTEQIAARMSTEAVCGDPVSDQGFVVGLFPALVYDGAKSYVAYRDVHTGQYPQQDWAGSDLEVVEGSAGSWGHKCVQKGGNSKQGYGGHISMVMAGGQPALVHDQIFGSADGTGQNVHFNRRKADGTWDTQILMSIGNTQSGASLAWDSQAGFGVAAVERQGDGPLRFISSTDGKTWSFPDDVFQYGSGGWYPSLAFDPVHHEPAVAFYNCSSRNGANEGSCQVGEGGVFIRQRIGAAGTAEWTEIFVDTAGGGPLKLGFLSSGRRVVAYRHAVTGLLTLAVER